MMRIAVLTWSRRIVGGTEQYLALALPILRAVGHEVLLVHEVDIPANRHPMAPEVAALAVGHRKPSAARAALAAWRPDLLYAHGLLDVALEEALVGVAPTVYFPHSYIGTCISGQKTFTFPTRRPCDRRFGASCLLRYYPRRTGGLNPVTMLRDFERQRRRLAVVRRAAMVVVTSAHMRDEYMRHGIPAARVRRLTYYVPGPVTPAAVPPGPPWRLLSAGRMDPLKGGDVLLATLPAVARRLGAVALTLAGDGPRAEAWRRAAERVTAREPGITVTMPGWLDEPALAHAYAGHHLLVMPSVWPEPFGRIGPEAGHHGLPAVAFAVGGVSEWLEDGVNGALAPGDPPSTAGLAEAIIRCLERPSQYHSLRVGAVAQAARYGTPAHFEALEQVFNAVTA